ncbi:wax ester/triacylglycerol synthase family O-acyltransferase [Mycolicibacterium sp. 018/SC-01/001]|uniref:WS/DGAT/MGAT family O-acyltransferase n=1 Tax=Mycolicibacterium sp. 018/SC-01/001 TaxID=2592069 RepID=UPI00117C125E|nr:wax ester/triacylglycerol synthase family O-acyltransferase [Mycolicibacterium sp. 018/SC-01/001]TRW89005.1 wax ester/triacylglycerol synthase family O-acyltransferase [Mycolicibacterium sp. 018/SC-01/001]
MSATSKRLGLQDLLFIYGETPSSKMHVAGLLPFTPPPNATVEYLREMIAEARRQEVVRPWNLKLAHPRLQFSPLHSWVEDKDFDFDYHVRRSALASPGDERELGILVSRLHSNHLDLTRPPWELHVIEGLEGGRFALYMKIHHALVDGYSAMRMLARSLSTDPESRDTRMFFNVPMPGRTPGPQADGSNGESVNPLTAALRTIGGIGATVSGGVSSVVDLTTAVVNTQIRRDGEYAQIAGSASAPHSILNARISRNRRFATQQYAFDRLKKLSSEHGATINDVALAILGGGLRRFLSEIDELPDRSLIAFLPVNVRPKGDEGGGNAVGAILAPMGTDIADPVERLHTITAATSAAKAQLQNMSPAAIIAYSAALLAPAGTQIAGALTGVQAPWPYTFNLCVSNVPGPREPLWFNGSRLEATYPVSIPIHGMALNITLQSYADTLNIGFVGCRDRLPHLQRLAVYSGEALAELEAASEG